MKKLISLLACAALLVGLVIAVFPAVSGTADTAITTPGFTNEAPGTTTFKLGGGNGHPDKAGLATLTVGEDKTYTYDLKGHLAQWIKNDVYASDNNTPADVRNFKYLYMNVTGLEQGRCRNEEDTSWATQVPDPTPEDENRQKWVDVKTETEAKIQTAFIATVKILDANNNPVQKKGTDGKFGDWVIMSDIRSKGLMTLDLEALKKEMKAQNDALSSADQEKKIDIDAVFGNLKLYILVYGKRVTLDLYASNNDAFNPTPVNPTVNPTVSLLMSASGDKGTVTKNTDGYFVVKPASDKIALLNVYTESGAGNVNASAYPYLHTKIILSDGAKITSAVLVDKDGVEYKKDGAAVNIFGGSVERTKQVAFELKGLTDADKAQFLSNLRIKLTIEGGTATVLSKLSTSETIKIGTDNVPGVTAHKLNGKPGAAMPGNAEVTTDEETGTVKFALGGHLAAWVPVAMYNGNKIVDANDYQYLIVDVKSMTDGRCRNNEDTSWAAEIPVDPSKPDGAKEWKDVKTEAEAKLQTGFLSAIQLTYKNSKGNYVQLKKVNLDANGNVKTKKNDKNETVVDGGDWNVLGEARQPMTMAPVDFHKLAEQVDENNAALDKALNNKAISQAQYDEYHMNLSEVLKSLTVRALIYGKEVTMDFYITNNGNFVPGEISPDVDGYESVNLGISKSSEYTGNPAKADAYYYLKTDSNYIVNPDGGAATIVTNLYALQGAGNMDARKYDYLYLRVNTLKDGTKISSIKLVDMEGNVLDQNLLGGEAVAGRVIRIDLSTLSDEQREQYLENTRLQVVMNGTQANIQAAFSINEGYAFEDYVDEDDPNYAYKMHFTPLHVEFNASDVTFRSDGSVAVNLSGSGAGLHVIDRNGAFDATQYKYMYLYLESGSINDIRFRTSDNSSEDDMKVQTTYAANPGLTRINLEEVNKTKPRLMKDLCFNFVIYVSTEITGVWFSNSPTFDPIATPTEADYEIVIGQQVAPVSAGATMNMGLDGSMDFGGKGEAHFKPITGTKGFNAASLKYLVVDVESGAGNLEEFRLRNKENNVAKSIKGLQNGLNYLIINKLDETILENIYFTMVVNGNVKIRSMWFTNEPALDPNAKALEPDYTEVDMSGAYAYLPQKDRETGVSSSKLSMDSKTNMISVRGPRNKDVGMYFGCYYDEYSNPAQAMYLKFGVVNRPTYVVAYSYDLTSDDEDALSDVLTVDIQPGVYNGYVRIDLRDSSFYSAGFSGFLEIDIYSPAQEGGSGSANDVAFTLDNMFYQGTASPALSRLARKDSDKYVPVDGALYLDLGEGYDWGDGWGNGGSGGAQTGEHSAAIPVAMLAVVSGAAMVVVRRKRKQKV